MFEKQQIRETFREPEMAVPSRRFPSLFQPILRSNTKEGVEQGSVISFALVDGQLGSLKRESRHPNKSPSQQFGELESWSWSGSWRTGVPALPGSPIRDKISLNNMPNMPCYRLTNYLLPNYQPLQRCMCQLHSSIYIHYVGTKSVGTVCRFVKHGYDVKASTDGRCLEGIGPSPQLLR